MVGIIFETIGYLIYIDILIHYVKQPYYIVLRFRRLRSNDDQLGKFQRLGLSLVSNDQRFLPIFS